jgi:hypothetical protein
LQILGALSNASSGTLRDTIQQLFCFRSITWFSTLFSSRCVSDRHLSIWHLPVSGSSTWIECLNSCLWVIQLDVEPPQTQQNFIRLFPRLFFLSLGRHVGTNGHMVKDCTRVTFPVMFDMVPYAFLTKIWYPYQLGADISHLTIPRTTEVITWRSSEYSADGFDCMTLGLRLLRSRQHLKTTSRKQRGPLNCQHPALRGTQLNR